MQTNDGRLVVVSGASRSGKTKWVADQVRGQKRVIVWDIEAQWCELSGYRKITTRAELFAAVQSGGPAKLAYVAGGDIKAEFNFWAACVMLWGRYRGGCVAIAEELADVSSVAKAPQDWGVLLRRGLKRGITIYAISQRWAEADKTAIGNASTFAMFSMLPSDAVYLAKKTGLVPDLLSSLTPEYWPSGAAKKLPYLVFDRATKATKRAELRFQQR